MILLQVFCRSCDRQIIMSQPTEGSSHGPAGRNEGSSAAFAGQAHGAPAASAGQQAKPTPKQPLSPGTRQRGLAQLARSGYSYEQLDAESFLNTPWVAPDLITASAIGYKVAG